MKKKSLLREVITGPKHELKDFLVPSSDTKGHSVNISLRISRNQARLIQEILAAKRFPYKTISDLARHAVFKHLHWLDEIEPELEVDLDYMDIPVEAAMEEQMHLSFLASVRTVETTINQMLNEDMRDAAKEMGRRILEKLDRHSSIDPWKKKLAKELRKKFKKYNIQ